MRNQKIYLPLLCFALLSCKTKNYTSAVKLPDFYKEGHRGGRGLMPENTIPAMINGIANGANVCELDTYTSKDGLVIVSHDPIINGSHSLTPEGKELSSSDANKYTLHQMDYADISRFDVGSKYYAAFPRQQKLKTQIPLLANLIDSVENYTHSNHIDPVFYNVELKTSPKGDGVYNDTPQKLADAIMAVVKAKNVADRVHIQSFDIRALQYFKKAYPKMKLSFLVENKNTIEENIKQLGFYPEIYSPYYKLVTNDLITFCHQHSVQVIPWTVNEADEMQRLIDMKTDGIISDYPDLFKSMRYAHKD